MKRQLVLHPFLFGVYPVIALLAFNIAQTRPSEALRSLVVIVVITAVLLLLFKLVTQNWHKAGLISALWLFLFLAYGHLTRYVEGVVTGINTYDLNRYLTAVFATILILGTWGIWRLIKRDLTGVTAFLNVVTAVALILPLYTVIRHSLINIDLQNATPITNQTELPFTADPHQLPDIYYIITDAYTRADILEEIYNYDNSPFINALKEKGFFVASNSYSNYGQTSLSLSSSLNMQYINYLTERVGVDSEDRAPLSDLMKNSQLRANLEQLGYQTITISSGWEPTQFTDFDTYFSSSTHMLNSFESILVNNSWFGTFYQSSFLYEVDRQRILYIFDTLLRIPDLPGPKFVFIHMVSPHPPFVFGPNGERINPDSDYTLFDGNSVGITRDNYIRAYSDQITYLNKRLEESIDTILIQSPYPPIIVLQGDHGPGAFLDWGSVENTCVRERLAILNAIYLPNGEQDQLPDSLTPANTFRLISNLYYESNYETLENVHYFSTWRRPYDLVDVTNRVGISCEAK